MTKEEWKKVREEPYIPLGVWFSYYKENGGDITDPIEFEKKFNDILRSKPIFYSIRRGTVMQITLQTAKNRLFKYYDSIYN